MPKVTIIVPCYNQAAFLEPCLDSVLSQTFTDWECLLIDDGSTDSTGQIAKKYSAADPRFKYFKTGNQGVAKTRNLGLDTAKGDWIQFLDADDILLPGKLQQSLENPGRANTIITNFSMILENEIKPPFCDLSLYNISFENLVSRWDIDFNLPIHCVLLHKEILGSTRFPEKLKAKEDWIFWLEIFRKKEVKPMFINQKLVYYRQNSAGASKKFLSVFKDNFEANEFIYNTYDNETKNLVFKRLNAQNLTLNNTNFQQKNYIRKLQSTKVLKHYLKFREKCSKFFKI